MAGQASRASGWFPRELLREAVPAGDLHTDEERRLLYVAMTRAQERLILTTHGAGSDKAQSRFIADLLDGAGPGARLDRPDRRAGPTDGAGEDDLDFDLPDADADDGEVDISAALAAARRVMPLPTARERRLALRLRASELVGLLEGTAETDPEAAGARAGVRGAARRHRPCRHDGRRRGTGRRARSAHVPVDRARLGRRREPPPGRAAAADVQLLVARPLRAVPAPVRLQLRLPDPGAGPAEGGGDLRLDRARGLRGVHPERRERIARGEAPPIARGPRAPLQRRVDARRPSATGPPRRRSSAR